MLGSQFIPLVIRQVARRRVRTLLTLGGVATAMFLFVAVQAMQRGVAEATELKATDNTLVVYRKDRYCPFASRLPEYYGAKIARVPGVRSVTPMKIVVNNCRSSLDVITFRGVPKEGFIAQKSTELKIIEGSIEEWSRRSDAALLGKTLADRRSLKTGDRFDGAGVTAYVAGVVESDEPQDHNVAYVHLDFLQKAVDKGLGIVTQFNVKVDDPSKAKQVIEAIDSEFAAAEQPTATRAEKAFVAQAAGEVIELVGFTRYVGWGCLAAVLALVGNAIVLSIQDRIKEHAILQTLGYRGWQIGLLVIAEGSLLGVAGGALGTIGATALVKWTSYSLSMDGLSIPISAEFPLVLTGLAISMLLGALAGLIPGIQASQRSIAGCFRAV